MPDPLDRRCGTCARFVRVFEVQTASGETRNAGECLLGVWPAPLYETGTCSQWVQRGQFHSRAAVAARPARSRAPRTAGAPRPGGAPLPSPSTVLPEDLLEMDAEEFRRVLSDVLREELGVRPVELAAKWSGGELVLKPGKEGLQEKRIPIDALFHKVVMVRDRLRVLEQRINGHPNLGDEEKVQMQQYVTACYGSLTTFNVLFAEREDQFVGQKSDE
jgi:hypothetical protein